MININKKLYEDKAKQMTKEYLKNNPDLKFVAEYGKDNNGNPTVSFKIVKIDNGKSGSLGTIRKTLRGAIEI